MPEVCASFLACIFRSLLLPPSSSSSQVPPHPPHQPFMSDFLHSDIKWQPTIFEPWRIKKSEHPDLPGQWLCFATVSPLTFLPRIRPSTQPTAIPVFPPLTVFPTPCFEDVLFGATEPVSVLDAAVIVLAETRLHGGMQWRVVVVIWRQAGDGVVVDEKTTATAIREWGGNALRWKAGGGRVRAASMLLWTRAAAEVVGVGNCWSEGSFYYRVSVEARRT